MRDWRRSVCDTFVELNSEPSDPTRFDGTIVTTKRAGLPISLIEAQPQLVSRTEDGIRRSRSDRLFFVWQLGGSSSVEHGEGGVAISSGEGVLFDPNVPYTLRFEEAFTQVCIQVPKPWLRDRMPRGFGPSLGQRLTSSTGIGSVLQAATGAMLLDDGLDEATVDVFLDVLARSLHSVGWGQSVRPQNMLDYGARLRHFVTTNMADETLSPSSAASELGCSLRQIHKICAGQGTTFGRLVLETRLGVAGRLLAYGQNSAGRISDIAYECGFGDLSHFCRSFKAHYGSSPKAFRALCN